MGGRRAVVVGAGIGGLAAAIALRRAGWQVEVRERATRLHPLGAGLSMWPNAVRALDALGLGDRVRMVATPVGESVVRRWDGRLLARPDVGGYPARYGAPLLAVHRADLHRVLLGAAGEVRLGAEVAQVDELDADVVVAADGVNSRARAAVVGDGYAARPAGYVAWRAVVDGALSTPCGGEHWGRGERFGWLPLTGERVYWFATAAARPGGRPPDGELAELRRRFTRWADPVPALLAATPPAAVLRHDVRDLRPDLPTFIRGRVALLGDAAHAMTPDLGQGAAQALEDAVVLAACLERADVAAGLAAYDAARRPRTQAIARQARRLGRVAQLAGPGATVRDLAVAMARPSAAARALDPILAGPATGGPRRSRRTSRGGSAPAPVRGRPLHPWGEGRSRPPG
jgi:2-polyprenyl-6-methoxyphenol hydroxylase-like FAD-dependent oxidoreductase